MGLNDRSDVLWRQRNLLELLLFKLEEERLIVRAGLSRWLPRATHEVELVVGELQLIQEATRTALDGVAPDLGLPPGRSLTEVAAAAPAPWGGLLERHQEAIALATVEIGPLGVVHRDLLGQGATDPALVWLERTAPEWPLRAGAAPAGGAPLRVVPDGG